MPFLLCPHHGSAKEGLSLSQAYEYGHPGADVCAWPTLCAAPSPAQATSVASISSRDQRRVRAVGRHVVQMGTATCPRPNSYKVAGSPGSLGSPCPGFLPRSLSSSLLETWPFQAMLGARVQASEGPQSHIHPEPQSTALSGNTLCRRTSAEATWRPRKRRELCPRHTGKVAKQHRKQSLERCGHGPRDTKNTGVAEAGEAGQVRGAPSEAGRPTA